MWEKSLRQGEVEEELVERVNKKNGRETNRERQELIDSTGEVKNLLANLTNTDMMDPKSVLASQVHLVNF